MLSGSVRTFVRLSLVFAVGFIGFSAFPDHIKAQGTSLPEVDKDNVEYVYDDLGRLIEVVYAGERKAYRYTYDDAGNRLAPGDTHIPKPFLFT